MKKVNLLTAKITWVSPLKKNNKDEVYRMVSFELFEDGCKNAHVYLSPTNRNYEKWESLLDEGNVITGLVWKDKSKKLIDGDSPVELK